MSRINIKRSHIYLDRPLRQDETADEGYRQGKPPGPDLHDKVLESHEHRQHFQENEGDISIIIEAGEELGDIGVCVQYEGQIVNNNKRLADQCVGKQSEIIQDTAGWLHDILTQFESDWEAEIDSAPCPVADKKLEVRAAIERLTGVEVKQEISLAANVAVERKVEVK